MIYEIVVWPRAPHDDLMDMVTQALIRMDVPVFQVYAAGPSARDIAKETAARAAFDQVKAAPAGPTLPCVRCRRDQAEHVAGGPCPEYTIDPKDTMTDAQRYELGLRSPA